MGFDFCPLVINLVINFNLSFFIMLTLSTHYLTTLVAFSPEDTRLCFCQPFLFCQQFMVDVLCLPFFSTAIARTLIPRYFRSIFEGGVTDLYYVLKYPKESFHNTTITLDCEQALMVTQHGKPMFPNVSILRYTLVVFFRKFL